jgi:hypothetical protein
MSQKTFDTHEISHISFKKKLGLCFTPIHRRIFEPKLVEDKKQFLNGKDNVRHGYVDFKEHM